VIFMAEPGVLRVRALRAAARHPQVLDAVLGAALATLSLVALTMDHDRRFGHTPVLADYAAAVLAAVLIAVRRRWPRPVLAVSTVAAIVFTAAAHTGPVLVAAAMIAAYTMASVTPRMIAWLIGGSVALLMYAASVRWSDFGWTEPQTVGIFAWTGMAVAIGDAVRTRRAYVAAVEERARRAEESRDSEARRRVVEERLRIARELHDTVAHHIAMINVQAGVAAHVLRQQPDQAEEALGHVRQAARTVLDELSTVLGVLRAPDEPDSATEPTRGLGKLTELLDGLAAAGMQVEHRQNGAARPLPSAVDLAAYRIVQESLTNAQKHGDGGAAQLRLDYTAAGLTIEIANPAVRPPAASPGNPAGGTGHGILGMRERVAAVGGTLHADPDAVGRFVVRAVLPAPLKGET
jgi:signal transduction histidine kinase